LQAEGLYDKQRALPSPSEFTSVAVVCPAGAAGLGDFKSHADPLEDLGLCRFTYFTATFQGEKASPEIVEALRNVIREHRVSPFDCVIILRGGGAQADLAWLNDHAIANAVAKTPLPVLVAIGHERDVTILDEIANVSFHTPSKAIGHVTDTIKGNGQAALAALDAIWAQVDGRITRTRKDIDHVRDVIGHYARGNLASSAQQVDANQTMVHVQAGNTVAQVAGEINSQRRLLKESSNRLCTTAKEKSDAAMEIVAGGVDITLTAAENGLAQARAIINGAASKGLALANQDIDGCRLLIRDRTRLYRDQIALNVDQAGDLVCDNARRQMDSTAADLVRHRQLIRDRSMLGVETVKVMVKAEAEFVIGIGPKKTLARGFSMAKKKGKTITRKAQVQAGDVIEVEFSDGDVGAVVQ
jgi:exodeoxyribonuclease VII large subunit